MTTSSLLRRFYRAMQKRNPGVLFHGDSARPEIALTFDDGPHPHDTPRVLEALAKHGIRATFFLIGHEVERHPNLVKQIHQSGHQLALHCYRHVPFPLENASTLKGQLDRSRKSIADACGFPPETIRHVRPPYGFFTAKTLSLLTEWGYRLVLWDNMPLHFLQPTAWTIKQLIEPTHPGSIIVLHDGKGHGAKVAHILETVLPQLKAEGLEFVTIEQMQGLDSASLLANTQ
ncbi:MAG: polysaccharide deacetylase family protein [Anaerolineales bacterium]|nr:polysaccharide deacetylase family protein [Anaerolineales bacterium]NUQ86089.1 polysaccharide deacetylase family protein [Anaerolineales bacterium]